LHQEEEAWLKCPSEAFLLLNLCYKKLMQQTILALSVIDVEAKALP